MRPLRLFYFTSGAALVLLAVLADHVGLSRTPGFGSSQKVTCAVGFAVFLCGFLPKSWRWRLTYVLSSTLIAVLLSGVLLELYFPDLLLPVYRADKDSLYSLTPCSRYVHRIHPGDGSSAIPIEINCQGFRGPEIAADQPRIAVYGDSFIYAHFVPYKETFVHQLENQLKIRLHKNIRVVNAGVDGYGPDQALLKMQNEVPTLNPQFIVLAIYPGNDYGDLVRNNLFHPHSIEDQLNFSAPDVNTLKATFERNVDSFVLQRLIKMTHDTVITRGFLSQHYATLIKPLDYEQALRDRQNEYHSSVLGETKRPTRLGMDSPDFDMSLLPDSNSARYKLRLMKLVLKRIRDYLIQQEIPLYIMIIPGAHDLGGTRSRPVAIDLNKYPDYSPQRLTDSVAEICDELQISHLNLFKHFSTARTDRLYLNFDLHWNSAAQSEAAQLIATELVPDLKYLTDRIKNHTSNIPSP